MSDEEIRTYVCDHWRDPWKGGGAGRGTVNDAAIILFSETTSPEGRAAIRAEFERLTHPAPAAEGGGER